MSVFRRGFREAAMVAGAAAMLAAPAARAQTYDLIGKVVMEDGSPPPKPVGVERVCGERNPVRVASSNVRGEVRWSEAVYLEVFGECIWRAVLSGYESSELDMATIQKSNNIPDFVLRGESTVIPQGAASRWARVVTATRAKKWTEAEAQLRAILVSYPKSGPVWAELGNALVGEQRDAEARPAFERAIELAPRYLRSYGPLIQLQINAEEYALAEKTIVAGTKADAKGTLPELYLELAEVRVHLKEDGAESAARQAIALDKKHAFPRAEYVLGLVLADGGDNASAIAHLQRYLELAPGAPETAAVKSRIVQLQTSAAADAADAGAAAPADRTPEGATEVAVPGGLQALAAMARLKRTPAAADFFREYCEAIATDADFGGRSPDPGLDAGIETYLAAAVELSRLAENRSGRITLSPDALPSSKTAAVLKLFGWKNSPKGAGDRIELGETAGDSPRQEIPAALGIDDSEMAKALGKGESFHFEVHSAQAPLIEARAWRALAGGLPPGGFAEIFARNPRYAAAYAGLASMGPGAAAALISRVGLRVLANRYSDVLRQYGKAFSVAGDAATVPGGAQAESGWEGLAGANPRDAKAFFAALISKDQGKLAAFYFALAQGGAARERFFTRSVGAMDRFYAWYRDSDDFRSRSSPRYEAWRQRMFAELPLDGAGAVRFPGGRAAWTAASGEDADVLIGIANLQALVPVAELERARKAPFDEASARLLAENYAEWRSLFPYFEKLPGLGRADFEALAAFEKNAAARPAAARNVAMGEWHSLVKLIELASEAGSLDGAAGARAFRRTCEALSSADPSAQALAALREMAGGAQDLDEAVPATLLRLSGERRAAFERVKEIERTPRLDAVAEGPSGRALAALAGQVYAAALDPDMMLVAEDTELVSKHAFLEGAGGTAVFAGSSLETFHEAPSSHFAGGFAEFEETAARLAKYKPVEVAAALPGPSAISAVALAVAGPTEAAPSAALFRASARLVEVFATVTEEGRYLDMLERTDFTLLDNGQPVKFGAFENLSAGVTVALVLDTTGSMLASLPALKSSALKLIDDLRPVDTVAVYSFNSTVSELQPLTGNKDLARRAVLRTRAAGATGLDDALVRVARDLSARPGKKAIVVFTDGADNTSLLAADTVVRRANAENVRVYTISHGDALQDRDLSDQLGNLAKSTGGLSFAIQNPTQIDGVFEHIAQDLLHGYLLAFQPPELDGKREWRSLQIVLRDDGHVNPPKVRARTGYTPED